MSEARAFVTGGSGFVGGALITLLRAEGFAVLALARSETAMAAVAALGAQGVRGDLDDEAAMRAGMAGCEVAFHAAARVEPWGTREDFVRANVDGTQHVLDAARAAGVRRVVHISTEALLLGGPPIVRADETWPVPKHPIGLYAETKGRAEERVLSANRDGLETVIVRPRFVWGAGDNTLIPKLGKAMRKGQWAWLGGGRHLTSTCHVRNVCEGALAAARRGKPGEIYFLTDGAPVEFRHFITRMMATQGITPPPRDLPLWLALPLASLAQSVWRVLRLGGEPPLTPMSARLIGTEVTVVDDKARRELGYEGRVTIEEGLRELAAQAPLPVSGS